MNILKLIGTTLHELKHAIQVEKEQSLFKKKSNNYNSKFENVELSEYFGKCENDARMFEHKKLSSAVYFYNQSVKKSFKR